jgi:polyhydroxyalkanoic acid synthase PhaR subunit
MKGVPGMVEEENSSVPADPMESWEKWYETTSKAWSQNMNGSNKVYTDPVGFYQTWTKIVENAQEQIQEQLKASSLGLMDPKEAWKRWFETTTDIWEKAAGRGLDPLGLTTQWLEMMEDTRARILAGANLPADPFSFMKQWYDATNETWATLMGDIIGTEKFMESASQFLESYSSFYRTFRRANEEFFSNLQLPTRSDIARVAELVIAVEEKVELNEDAIEDLDDKYSRAVPGNLEERLSHIEKKLDTISSSMQELTNSDDLEKRLDRVESKLDKLLKAVEKSETKEPQRNSKPVTPTRSRAQVAKRESSKEQALPANAESVSGRMK